MLYGEELHLITSATDDTAMATAVELEAATGAILQQRCFYPCTPLYFGYLVTVTFNYDTLSALGILTLYKYPGGVSGSKIALDTINLTNARAAHHVYAVLVDQVPPATTVPSVRAYADCEIGDILAIEITTQAAGGQAIAGDYQPFIIVQQRGESTVNMDNWHIVTA